MKVVERLGDQLIRALGNKAPSRSQSCSREECAPCTAKPGSCRKRNVTYFIECAICSNEGKRSIYWGETHRTWWDRFSQHKRALETGDEMYAVVKHMMNNHSEMEPVISFKVY